MADIDDLRIEDQEEKPPRRRMLVVIMISVAAVTAAALSLFCFLRSPDGDERGNHTPTQHDTAETEPVVRGITAGGYIEVIPPGPVVVSPLVEGRISELAVVEGDKVEAGSVLVLLDDTIYRQRLEQAEAAMKVAQAELALIRAGFRTEEIAEAEARLAAAEARRNLAGKEQTRNISLAAIGAVPAKLAELSQGELEVASAEIRAEQAQLEKLLTGARPEDIALAEARLAAATVQREQALWAIEACRIKAPVDGIVLELFVRVGEWIGPAKEPHPLAPTASGGALMTLFQPDALQIWVDVNQRDAGRIYQGQPVSIRADALRDEATEGQVTRIMPKANLQRNTVQVKIAFAKEDGPPTVLRPDMSVQVIFQSLDQSPDSLSIEAINHD